MAKKNQNQAAPAATHKKGTGYYVKKIFTDSCIYYTIMVLILVTIDTILSGDESQRVIFGSDFLGLYPFAFLIGCANLILKNKKLKVWIRVALHAVFILGGFAIYMATVKQLQFNSIALISSALVIVYVLIMTTVLVILGLKAKSERENVEYKSVYNINSPSAPQTNNTRNKARKNSLADIEKDAMEELSESKLSDDKIEN